MQDHASQPQKRKVSTALEIALSKAETSQTTQPPAGAIPAEELEGGKPSGRRITLGRDITSGKLVTIDNRDRVRGNYVIGRPGFGKSIHLEQSAVQDAEKGLGFAFLDPHGDVLDHILCRMPQERIDRGDVIFVDPLDHEFPYGQNPYECASSDPVTKRQTFNQVEQIFTKIFGMSKETPRLSQYVRNITAVLIANQGMTMCEIPLLLDAYDDRFRKRLVDNLEPSHPARYFWKDYDNMRPLERLEHAGSTKDRIDALINNGILQYIVGQSKSTIDFQMVMNTGKILLVKLPGDDEDITTLLGSVIINQLLLAALSRKNIPEKKRRQFNIYADEFQRFAIPSFGQLLVEARKYRIATICANQVLNDLGEQLRPRMLNAGCLVVFNVQDEDATDLAGEFNYTPPQAKKPDPVVPLNVLEHVHRHWHKAVRELADTYIMPLEDALSEKERYEDNYQIEPVYDFSEGEVAFNRKETQYTYRLLEKLIRQTIETGAIPSSLHDEVIIRMGELLLYHRYINKVPCPQPHLDFTKVLGPFEKIKEAIESCEKNITTHKRFLEMTDEELIKYLERGMAITVEEVIKGHAKRAASYPPPDSPERHFAWLKAESQRALAEWEQMHMDASPPELWMWPWEKFSPRSKRPLTEWEIWHLEIPEVFRGSFHVNRLRKGLQSDEAFIELLLEDGNYSYYKTPEGLWKHMHSCSEGMIASRKRSTLKDYLACIRQNYQQIVDQSQQKLAQLHKDWETELSRKKATYEASLLVEKERHDRFMNLLDAALHVLMTPEGKILVPSTEWQETILTQQTHSDKRSEIANALTHLPVGRAWVRLTTSDGERKVIAEHVIDTIMPTGFSEKELERKRTQVVAYTRANYCKPRHEVEEEIRQRQNIDTQPTTRKHTL